jgi:uncharacterized membrane protein
MSFNSDVLSKDNTKQSSQSAVNVGDVERLACAIAGGAMAVCGLRRRSASGLILTLAGAALLHRGGTGHCNTYQALGITTAGNHEHDGIAKDVHVEKSITIDRTPEELFGFWRQFENLPRFMDHLESVNSVGFNRWHWVAKGPVGTRPEWDAEIYNEKPNELIAWRSLDGTITNAGSVHFDPAADGHGTQVKVVMNYNAPGGKVSALLAKVFGQEPGQMIEEDLRRLKDLFESGEIGRSQGQSTPTASNRYSTSEVPANASENDQPSTSMTPASELAEGRAASSSR